GSITVWAILDHTAPCLAGFSGDGIKGQKTLRPNNTKTTGSRNKAVSAATSRPTEAEIPSPWVRGITANNKPSRANTTVTFDAAIAPKLLRHAAAIAVRWLSLRLSSSR